MIPLMRAGLALGAALALAATAVVSTAAPKSARPEAAAGVRVHPLKLAPGQWPQSRSDLKADPDVRFGALPNGMRYAIRKQQIPPGQSSLRLWIDAGSLDETDAEQGLAHFLEHMAFNGSKRIKEGEMIKTLERLGLTFGPDTNAGTNFDETTYMLDLPKTNEQSIDTALLVLREAAGELTIAPDAVDRERGVVLSEERLRDTPMYRITKAQIGFLMPGQRVPNRFPIGQVDVLKTAPAARIQGFYRRFYRPERAVLVAAGDFDPTAMEAKIRAQFSDWKGEGPAGSHPDLGAVKPRTTEAKVVVEPGGPLILQVSWIRPPDRDPDTVAERRGDLVRRLGFAVLNRRFSAIGRSPKPPFIAAQAYAANEIHSAEMTAVGVNSRPDQWRPALAAIEQEARRAALYGVRQDELDREIEELRASMKAAARGAATRRQSDLANEIVGSLSDDEVVTSPVQELELFEQIVKGLKADEVSRALKASFSGQGPLLFMATPQPVEGGERTLLAEYAGSQRVAVAAPAATSQIAWPYENFGPAGKVAERHEAADLGTTFIRFENGVRLTVKPTKFRDDEVLVRVNIGDGILDLPKDRLNMEWFSGAFLEGGLKKISNEDMERVLAAKVYGSSFGYGDDTFVLSGGTRTGDLPTQLQVLAGYVAEPGWRPEAFQRLKTAGTTVHDQLEATPNGVLSRELNGLLHPGDRRWVFPTRDEIAQADFEALRAQVTPHLTGDPIEVVIVGDVTVDKAVEAVAATFGALPPRPAPPPVPDAQKQVRFPEGRAQPLVLTHKGRADQAVAYVAWPTADLWANPQRARETSLLTEVLKNRLTEELREAQGSTYSPSAGATHSLVFPGWGYVAASVEVPPAKLPEFFSDVQKITADLRTKEISADELARAKKPRIESLQRARVTNPYWLTQLSNAQRDPRRLELIRELIPGAEKVTAADVKRVAETFLKDDKAFRLVVKPQGS